MALYVPPVNFGIIEAGAYRSGQPCAINLPFLERLKLKTIINLQVGDFDPRLLVFVKEQGIDVMQVGCEDRRKAWNPLSEEDVFAALQLLLDRTRHPILVISQLGSHRTGAVVGCLRKVQRWNLTSILEEYRRYAGSKVRVLNEQFIELFDLDLIKIPPPSKRPSWL